MDQERIRKSAELLRNATDSRKKLVALPDGIAPRSEAEAYAIHSDLLGQHGIGGWKIGAIHAPGPFVASALPPALPDARLPTALVAPEVEVELAIMLRADLPLRDKAWTSEDIRPALGPCCTAIEILDCRFENRKTAEWLSLLADLGGSGAVRLGTPFADWEALDLPSLPVTMQIDGKTSRSQGNATMEQTMLALAWLANHAAGLGTPLRKRQFVITGARLGPVRVMRGQTVTARFGALPDVDLLC